MRDCMDNVVIICSIENMDLWESTGIPSPWPRPDITDLEYQKMRDASVPFFGK